MRLATSQMRRLAGFGQVQQADSYAIDVTSVAEIREALDLARQSGRKVCLRGEGRSYGDASLAAEQVSICFAKMHQILDWDPSTGVATLEPGVTIRQLADLGLRHGWWPPVVSGTAHVSIAGALAMNIHGKNHFRAGTLAQHVVEIEVLRADGTLHTLGPDDPDFTWLISSAGLLGIITSVKLQLHRVVSAALDITCWRSPDWLASLDDFLAESIEFDYLVGWVDMFHPNGRAIIHGANYSSEPDQDSLNMPPREPSALRSKVVPILRMLNRPFGNRLLNAAKVFVSRRNPHGFSRSLNDFNFLLDSIPEWRRAYRNGFLQYQIFIPSQHAREILPLVADACRSARFVPRLAVLKRHREDPFPLSYALDGVSLAMDFAFEPKRADALRAHLQSLTRIVLGCGGKFYMAKDSVLSAEEFRLSLGEDVIEEFRRVKSRWDPEGILTSQLGQRLGLCPTSGYSTGP